MEGLSDVVARPAIVEIGLEQVVPSLRWWCRSRWSTRLRWVSQFRLLDEVAKGGRRMRMEYRGKNSKNVEMLLEIRM